MNGPFKIALTKEKEKLVCFKEDNHLSITFSSTDVMPLINRSWISSFGDVTKGLKALADRGWGPLNKALLVTENILKNRLPQERDDATRSPLDLNVDGGFASQLIDKLVAKQDHKKARERVLEKK